MISVAVSVVVKTYLLETDKIRVMSWIFRGIFICQSFIISSIGHSHFPWFILFLKTHSPVEAPDYSPLQLVSSSGTSSPVSH